MSQTSLADPRSRVAGYAACQHAFRWPARSFGPIPFYWWAGERLERERLAWQLDQLVTRGVRQVVISYPHGPEGRTDGGEPPLFSAEWWDLLRWFLGECRARGMSAGFQDYTLTHAILRDAGASVPDMHGGQLSCVTNRAAAGETVTLSAEAQCPVIGAWVYPICSGVPNVEEAVAVVDQVDDGTLCWTAGAGEWLVAMVMVRPNPFDPLHPAAGRLAIERLYAPFERECPEELGRTLNLFFQDELDFGSRMPFWSDRLYTAFAARHHYSLAPWLPALWLDLGPRTEKVRLDYADTVVRLMERNYFEPVFRWHEQHGTLFGHDNCGRGRIAEGRSFYGDYFRTMRWFSAPGCDDPKLQGARAFKGLKVNSSIAHLYRRPRVWVEAFHSSGWGTTPAEVIGALHEDFAFGANLVNLHGLYYTTRGGWWEWAPPDFHFRQPYWRHCGTLNDYFTRICWLLAQGMHRCDVAMVYPISALDAQPADPGLCEVTAHMGNDKIATSESGNIQPEECAFGLGKFLFDHACDFDFIDGEALTTADVSEGELRAGTARYRVLLFPAMAVVRFAMIEKAREFARSGGLVIAFGCLPRASDRAGRRDPVLEVLLEEVFGAADDSRDLVKRHPCGGVAMYFRDGYERVLEAIRGTIDSDVSASSPVQVLHRHLGELEVYFVCNPADEPVTTELRFRGEGRVEEWNAWTGDAVPLSGSNEVTVRLSPHGAKILVLTNEERLDGVAADIVRPVARVEELDGCWETLIHPTLDNSFGDFSLPGTAELLGPQARRFRHEDDVGDETAWQVADFDDSGWGEVTFSFGPQMEAAGPLPPDEDFGRLEAALLGGRDCLDWRPYGFSRRWGIERDPFLTDWLSGPHGLKGQVPDEFLDFHSEVAGSVWYVRAVVVVARAGEHRLVTGGRCRYQVWLNGEEVAAQADELVPGLHPPWNIPHYQCESRNTRVRLEAGVNRLLVKLRQPIGQRTRAFVAFDPPAADPDQLALRWFRDSLVPRLCLLASPGRRAVRFRFMAPPGAREFTFVARGAARAWAGGRELELTDEEALPEGCRRYRAVIDNPSVDPQVIALRVDAPADSHGGDALPEPVLFTCGSGRMPAGDWCAHGLATYSGAVEYRRTIHLGDLAAGTGVALDLGEVAATAEVRVNGQSVATLVAPPWRCELAPFLRAGDNELSVTVANTLANHYSVGIPTPYAFPSQTRSGLLGPVRLIIRQDASP